MTRVAPEVVPLDDHEIPQIDLCLSRGLGSGDQERSATESRAGRSDPAADVTVARAFVEVGILTHEAGEGHDLSPRRQLASQVLISPRVEIPRLMIEVELDDAFLDVHNGS